MILPLEIHHINVSQGDSTLIIFRDINKLREILPESTTGIKAGEEENLLPYAMKNHCNLDGTVISAVLIDGGEEVFGKDVADYLAKMGISKTNAPNLLAAICTHCHSDHADGLRTVFLKPGVKTKKVDNPPLEKNYIPKYEYDSFDVMQGKKTVTQTYNYYTKVITELETNYQVVHKNFGIQKTLYIGRYEGVEIYLECVYDNGLLVKNKQTGFVSTIDSTVTSKVIDQNALSKAVVLHFGRFRYFLGGDIAGNEKLYANKNIKPPKSTSTHPNIEKELGQTLCSLYPVEAHCDTPAGHMCGFKFSHHGSISSNDSEFLSIMKPVMGTISAGVRTRYFSHPSQKNLDETNKTITPKWGTVDNTMDGVYITEMKQDKKDIHSAKIIGDVIVRPDYVGYMNNVDNAPIGIQVFGTGEQSTPTANKPLRQNDGGAPYQTHPLYPYGPWYHKCDKHNFNLDIPD